MFLLLLLLLSSSSSLLLLLSSSSLLLLLLSLCDTEMILVTTCICRSLMGQWQRLEFKWNVQNNHVVTSFSTWSCLTPLLEKHYLNPPLAQAFSSSWAIFWSGPCSRTISTDVTANLRLHKKQLSILFLEAHVHAFKHHPWIQINISHSFGNLGLENNMAQSVTLK